MLNMTIKELMDIQRVDTKKNMSIQEITSGSLSSSKVASSGMGI